MNRNVLIVMAGGLLVAVLVAMIVQATLKGDRKKQPVKEEARVQIVVASKALNAGDVLTEANMKWVDWPKSGVFEGMLLKDGNKNITDIASGKVRRAMALNEPITKAALVEQKANFLAATLTPGMRAVAINASARSAAGGFVSPGDYVDIVLTYRPRINLPGGNEEASRRILQENVTSRAAETIMQNVKVLAVDQRATRNEEKVLPGKVYTMEVDPKGAQVLSVADSIGTLELVLRPLGDDKINDRLPAATDARMTHLYGELVQIMDEKRGGGGMYNIRIFSGNTVQQLGMTP